MSFVQIFSVRVGQMACKALKVRVQVKRVRERGTESEALYMNHGYLPSGNLPPTPFYYLFTQILAKYLENVL